MIFTFDAVGSLIVNMLRLLWPYAPNAFEIRPDSVCLLYSAVSWNRNW